MADDTIDYVNNTNSRSKSEKYIYMTTSSETWQLGNQTVQVSHLEKLYWPEAKFTKGDPPETPR